MFQGVLGEYDVEETVGEVAGGIGVTQQLFRIKTPGTEQVMAVAQHGRIDVDAESREPLLPEQGDGAAPARNPSRGS